MIWRGVVVVFVDVFAIIVDCWLPSEDKYCSDGLTYNSSAFVVRSSSSHIAWASCRNALGNIIIILSRVFRGVCVRECV